MVPGQIQGYRRPSGTGVVRDRPDFPQSALAAPLIRQQIRHSVVLAGADSQAFRGFAATPLDAAANRGKLVGYRQPLEPIAQKSRSPPLGGPCIRSDRRNSKSGNGELLRQSDRPSSG